VHIWCRDKSLHFRGFDFKGRKWWITITNRKYFSPLTCFLSSEPN